AKQGGQVGFVIDCEWAEPMSDKMEDQAAAARRIDFQLGWFLDPIYFGDYPESMRQRVGEYLPKFSEKDRELMRNKIDFIGLNHYTTRIIGNRPNPQPQEIHFYQVEQIERSGTMIHLSKTCLFCLEKQAQHQLKDAGLSIKTAVCRQQAWQKYFTLLIRKNSPSPLPIESIYLFLTLGEL
uniref:Uncharacterized protein n=2 Tax=Aegilops tauschii subsp. strangulata TaxID=200361 RepID=A0A453G546_AEGTS